MHTLTQPITTNSMWKNAATAPKAYHSGVEASANSGPAQGQAVKRRQGFLHTLDTVLHLESVWTVWRSSWRMQDRKPEQRPSQQQPTDGKCVASY